MRSYNLHRFSTPEFLRQVDGKLLLAFLHRFPEFKVETQFDGTIDYEKLSKQLASPEAGLNTELFDAWAMIAETAADRNFDLLQDAVNDKPYSAHLGDNASVGDLALLLWLNEPQTLERLHLKFGQNVPRSFVYFYGMTLEEQIFHPPTRHLRQRLSRLLNRIFQRRRRGRTVRIVIFEEPEEYNVLVRKGEPLTRDSSITPEGKTESVCYRPERFDIVLLRPKISELRLTIYRKAPWIVETYRTLFGHVFYDDREYFSGDKVFTLEPLLTQGEAALDCSMSEGIESVMLVQCKFATAKGEMLVIQGDLGIRVVKGLNQTLLEDGRIISAKFKVKFTDSKMARMVTVKAGNQAEFKYDDDGRRIEQWLVARGFKHEQH